MSTPKILDRITKLLQLAGPKNPHEQEARSAAHQAVKLILEHQIVLALPRTSARDGYEQLRQQPAPAPDAPPWTRPYDGPYDGGPPFTEPPPFTDDPFHPFSQYNAQQYDAQAYADYINRTMYQRAEQAARKQAERAQREAAARRQQQADDVDPIGFDDSFGFGRENRRARARAWRAAGRPMKKAFDPNTGDEIDVPNYDGLDV
jgi:hypothetical protein